MKELKKSCFKFGVSAMFSSFSRISSIHPFQFNTLIQQSMTLCVVFIYVILKTDFSKKYITQHLRSENTNSLLTTTFASINY